MSVRDSEIPGFDVLSKLGQGGMAKVYKARQLSLDRIVAIKILSSRLSQDPEDVQRFLQEAQAAASLKHPGIIQVYDAHMAQDASYFIMEYVAGYTMGDWVRRKGKIAEKDVLSVAECVADALQYAWTQAGMVHCDVKPDNIMIDEDGTVKVADLGLARTLNRMGAVAASDEVMGTPAYISPEQALGNPDLDCRADIYSLGATMYHLATGRMMFEGDEEEEILERQVLDTVPDAMELNPSLSIGFCDLLERMLMKAPQDRFRDWQEVIAAIDAVGQARAFVAPILRADARSTMPRTVLEPQKDQAETPLSSIPAASSGDGRMPLRWPWLLAAGVALLLFFFYWGSRMSGPAPIETADLPGPTLESGSREEQARATFEGARAFAADLSSAPADVIRRYQWVARETRGTRYARLAEEEALKHLAAQAEGAHHVLQGLEDEAAPLIAGEQYAVAARLFEQYHGPYEQETAVRRQARAAELRADEARFAAEARDLQVATQRFRETFLDEITFRMLNETLADARRFAEEIASTPIPVGGREDVQAIRQLLDHVHALEDQILQTFYRQVGEEVSVELVGGSRVVRIGRVEGGVVHAEQFIQNGLARASIPVQFRVDQLSLRERLRRMGDDQNEAVALAKGLLALEHGSMEHARRFFSMTSPRLSSRLLESLEARQQDTQWIAAEQDLRMLLYTIGVQTDEFDAAEWARKVHQARLTQGMREQLALQLRQYREVYDEDVIARARVVLAALETQAVRRPESVLHDRGVPDAPLLLDADIMPDWLQALLHGNPRLFRNHVSYETDLTDADRVVSVAIHSPAVKDLSALSVLQGIERVHVINESAEAGELIDLNGLRGLSLRELRIVSHPVKEILVLRGMPLENVTLRNTAVRSLDPLKGMAIHTLDVAGSRIHDFQALRAMPLTRVNLSDTSVKSMILLRGKSLSWLSLANSSAYDFQMLAGMPLEYLNVSGTQIRELSFVRGMPLRVLLLPGTRISDLSALQGLPLEHLDLSGVYATDFSRLAGMPLKHLELNGCRIHDLDVLRGMSLQRLSLRNTGVEDLSPLRGMPLVYLNLESTPVATLDALAGAPLRVLRCRATRIHDYSVLAGLPVEELWIEDARRHRAILQQMRGLRYLNGRDVELLGLDAVLESLVQR